MTVHAEDDFAVALRAYARSVGKSVNQAVKDVFAPILGLAEPVEESPWVRFTVRDLLVVALGLVTARQSACDMRDCFGPLKKNEATALLSAVGEL